MPVRPTDMEGEESLSEHESDAPPDNPNNTRWAPFYPGPCGDRMIIAMWGVEERRKKEVWVRARIERWQQRREEKNKSRASAVGQDGAAVGKGGAAVGQAGAAVGQGGAAVDQGGAAVDQGGAAAPGRAVDPPAAGHEDQQTRQPRRPQVDKQQQAKLSRLQVSGSQTQQQVSGSQAQQQVSGSHNQCQQRSSHRHGSLCSSRSGTIRVLVLLG